MFHLVMACMFFYRHCSRLKIYVSVLMLTIVAQYVKDLIFIGNTYYGSRLEEQYASSIDLLTLPMLRHCARRSLPSVVDELE